MAWDMKEKQRSFDRRDHRSDSVNRWPGSSAKHQASWDSRSSWKKTCQKRVDVGKKSVMMMKSWIRGIFFQIFFLWYVLFYTCWRSEFSTIHFALGEFIESMNIIISRITGVIALSQFLWFFFTFLRVKKPSAIFTVFSKCHESPRHDDIPGDCTLQCLRSDFKRKWRILFIASLIEEAGLHHFKPLLEGKEWKKWKKVGRKQLMFDEFVDCHVMSMKFVECFFFLTRRSLLSPAKLICAKSLKWYWIPKRGILVSGHFPALRRFKVQSWTNISEYVNSNEIGASRWICSLFWWRLRAFQEYPHDQKNWDLKTSSSDWHRFKDVEWI